MASTPRITSIARRMSAALALLVLGFGAVAAYLAHGALVQREQLVVQQLSAGLARHIVQRWPDVGPAPGLGADPSASHEAQQALIRMLTTVNPSIQVYLLDARGRVQSYLGEPGMVRVHQVDVGAISRFLAGDALPIRGTDPMGSGSARLFSAARLAAVAGATSAPGYLYVVLESPARVALTHNLSLATVWPGLAWALGLAALLCLGSGVLIFRRLARPMRQLAARLQAFQLDKAAAIAPTPPSGDELAVITQAFDDMAQRIAQQHASNLHQAAAHREVIANVAHDLRTPLTALQGQLECLGRPGLDTTAQQRHLTAALAQSQRMRRLLQQLFELASLQAQEQLHHAERFRLDELLADTVQQYAPGNPAAQVALAGAAPGPVEVQGDAQLIERALANLIDNALRHAPGPQPVQVSLHISNGLASVLVADQGPGLSAELTERLNRGAPLRDPALRRQRGGGLGGLGLAIVQRVADLHGGRLNSLPTVSGTTLCLSLPLRG